MSNKEVEMKRGLRMGFGGATAGLLLSAGISFIKGDSEVAIGAQIILMAICFFFYVLSEEE